MEPPSSYCLQTYPEDLRVSLLSTFFFTNIKSGQTYVLYSMIALSGKLGQMPQSCPWVTQASWVILFCTSTVSQSARKPRHLNFRPSALKLPLLVPFPDLTESSCSPSWYPKLGVQIVTVPSSGSISSVDNSIVLSCSNYTAGTTACQSCPKSLMLNFSQ